MRRDNSLRRHTRRAKMLGLTGSRRLVGLARLIGLGLVVIIGLAVWAPASAHASGCTDSWTNASGGNWFNPSNWSKLEPPKTTDEACITLNGTYTVEIIGNSFQVKSITIGGTSGTQTLSAGSSCSANLELRTTEVLS